ncbi:MAG TPA: hypothetical protein VFZ00_12735 [Solirubrobacter sp.]|nr:hypothetical protein [Solirubrobacter sp.]
MAPRVHRARPRKEERAFEHEERLHRVDGASAAVLTLQRAAGNHAVMRLLSRGSGGRLQCEPITDWGTEPVFRKHKSPPYILNLTEAVKQLRNTPKGRREERKRAADDVVLLAKGFWDALRTDPKLERYATLVRALEDAAKQEVQRLEKLIADYDLAAQREQQSRQLPHDIAQYAQHDPSSLREPDVTPYLPENWGVGGPSYAHALSIPRDPGGELSAVAIAEMNQMAQSELATDIAATREIKIDAAGKSPEQLRELMDRQRNPLSGKTMFPELANLAAGDDEIREKTRTVQLGGVSVTLTYDKNDETVNDRASMLAAALQKIAAAGVNVPAFNAYFPRYGRGLAIKDDCVAEQGVRKPAVFKAPDTLFLPAHIVANPKLEQGSESGPFFLSTALDASGVATTVHEIGHMLHYRHNPSGFHLLQETFHAGSVQDINQIANEVSAYAAKNPREFVAEVFLGLVYGRHFSPAVMQRYAGLRGAPVAPAPIAVAPPPAFGTGRTIAYPSKLAKEFDEAKQSNAPRLVLGRLMLRWQKTHDRDVARHAELKALLGPPPPGAVIDDARLRIELPYNYQMVREQHREFGLKLEELAKDFFTPEEKQLPGGDGVYSAKDLAGQAFNDPAWARQNELEARRLLKEARTEFANFDYDTYDELFGDSTPEQLAAEFAKYPEHERVGALMAGIPGRSLIVAESHGDPRSKGLIVDNIEALIAAGVDTLYVEHFRRNDYQSLLDIYNQTAGSATPLPPPLARLIENLDKVHNPGVTWPRNLKGVVEIAHRRGLKVMAMDSSGALTKTGEGMERRAARMNFVAAEAIKADVSRGAVQKFVMLVGEAHVHTHERGGEPATVPGLAELLGASAVRPGAQGPELLIEKKSNR